MEDIVFEIGIAVALISLAGLISTRFRSSVVPFYIIIGMLVGPHAPDLGVIDLRFIESQEIIDVMGRLGVVFLLFYLGLEFSIGRLIKSGRSILIGGSIYLLINFSIGLLYGWVMGFGLKEILLIAGIMTTSSSAIVAKVIVDLRRAANKETEMILGMVMVEDIFFAVYISFLSGILLSGATSWNDILFSSFTALAYMLLFLFIGRKAVPLLNRLLRIKSNEIFMFVIFSGLFIVAGFSEMIHVAEAIGALLVGLVIAETDHMKRIEKLIIPFRDFFGALFFFSFGLSINPTTLTDAFWLSIGAVILSFICCVISGIMAGQRAGLSYEASTNIGLTIMSRGEFSIIVANLGLAGGLLPVMQPFAALYVLILAILGPLLTKESRLFYQLLKRLKLSK